jgi:hypothetical protein
MDAPGRDCVLLHRPGYSGAAAPTRVAPPRRTRRRFTQGRSNIFERGRRKIVLCLCEAERTQISHVRKKWLKNRIRHIFSQDVLEFELGEQSPQSSNNRQSTFSALASRGGKV